MSAIEELYYGNNPKFDTITLPPEWLDYAKKVTEQMTKLATLLSNNELAEVDNLVDLINEQFTIERATTFKEALALGIGLGYESKKIMEDYKP